MATDRPGRDRRAAGGGRAPGHSLGPIAAALAAAALSMPQPAPGQTAQGPGTFNVRAHSGFPVTAMKFLIANGAPSTVELAAGASLEQAVMAKCGHYRSVYEPALRRLNPGLLEANLTARQAGAFRLPACARFEQDATVTIAQDISVGDFLQRETGFRGRRTMAAFLARNPQLGPLTAASVLPAGTAVRLDYRSEWVSIALNPSSGLTADQAQRRLGQLVAQARQAAEPSAATLDTGVGSTFSEVLLSARTRCAPRPASAPWPYDVGRLGDALKRAAAQAAGRSREARVAILDSAFPAPPAGPLTWERLATLDGPPPGPRNYYGLNADTRTDPPLSIAGIQDGDHGTQVATLALGGPQFLDAEAQAHSKVKVRLYSIVELGDPNRPGARATKVREDDVAFAIKDAKENDAYIINGSFEFPLEMQTIVPLIQSDSKLLLVAAAGNKPDDIDNRPRWPASFGGADGTIARQVLTVGASDSNQRMASFSSRNANKVDLLAPGCGVPTVAFDLSPREVNGTSFAAPLAAFTAGLVRQFGVTSGARLKERLLVATDVSLGLYHEAWAAGILNPAKALELFTDYVERDGASEPLRTKLDWTSTGEWRCLGSAEVPTQGRILKVARLDRPQGQPVWLVIWRTRGNSLRRCQADLSNEFITLAGSEGDEPTIPFATVTDLISAHDF